MTTHETKDCTAGRITREKPLSPALRAEYQMRKTQKVAIRDAENWEDSSDKEVDEGAVVARGSSQKGAHIWETKKAGKGLRRFAVSSEKGKEDDMLWDSQYEGMETEKSCSRRVDQELDVEMNVETLKSLAQTLESEKDDELLKENQEAALVAEGAVEDLGNTDKLYMMQKKPASDVSHSGPNAAQFQNAGPTIVLNGNEEGLCWVECSAESKEAKVKRCREGKTQLRAKTD
ncbi:hypothetical protein QQ045_027169 [Rhodiola kirilowii]